MSKNYEVGQSVFYKNTDSSEPGGQGKGWTIATLTAMKGTGKTYTVDDNGKTFQVKEEDLHTYMEGSFDKATTDLFGLGDLHQAPLLYCLKDRYCQDSNLMYTRMGEMVISINPFQFKEYNDPDRMLAHSRIQNVREAEPHVWEIAKKAYEKIINMDAKNQSILISGESGAGKTEGTKTLIEYLGRMSLHRTGCTAVQREIAQSLNTKLKACNPVLESFGNAKTVRNDNSSRFGKYIKLYFNKQSGVLVGAQMEHYLLEKSRIVTQSKDERGYHVFYEMLKGMTPEQKAKYEGLTEAKDYPSLAKGEMYERILNGKVVADDAVNFKALCTAFDQANISKDMQDRIFSVLAGILWLAKMEFDTNPSTGKAVVRDEELANKAARLFKVDPKEFCEKLCIMSYMKDGTPKPASVMEACDTRDALAKALYATTFDWLVKELNQVIKPTDAAMAEETRYIGLLDIFGFEKFQVNTFEQFCINYTNESLQNHYNGYTFVQDEQECKEEGISVPQVAYPDNAACLKMLDHAKTGIFAQLDETCKSAVSKDSDFTQAVWEMHGTNADYFVKPKSTRPDKFTVKHYASDVEYMTEGWREKNADTLKDPIKMVMEASVCEWTAELLPPSEEKQKRLGLGEETSSPARGKKAISTVSSKFKAQMQSLRTELSSTESHFVRTVKPNPQMKPCIINNATVMAQLTSAGVIETIKMKRAGYPIRSKHRDFYLRYRIIAPQSVQDRYAGGKQPQDGDEVKGVCREIATALLPPVKGVPQFDVGFGKVFAKAEASDVLEGLRTKAINNAKVISRAFISRWALSWKNRLREKAIAEKQRREEIAKIREEKRKAHEEQMRKEGKTAGSLPGKQGEDFSALVALFPHFELPIIADCVRIMHTKFPGEAHEKAVEFLLDIQRQRLVDELPVCVKDLFKEAKLGARSQQSLTDAGVTTRAALFNVTLADMDKYGLSAKEKEGLEQVLMAQQSDWVVEQRLQIMMESGGRKQEEVVLNVHDTTDRDIAALSKAANAITKQIDAAHASRLVGEEVSLRKGGYNHQQVARFVAMGYDDAKAKAALRKARHDPVKACELLLAAK